MRRREFITLLGGGMVAWPQFVGAAARAAPRQARVGSYAVAQSGEISASFFFRERSFSLMYFAGMTHDAMPELLARCGYSIIGEAQYDAPFLDVLDTIEVREGSRNIVRKATYRISGGRVLLDPEMTVAFVHTGVVAQLCAEHRADAFVAVWERVSETVLARHIGSNGVIADVASVGGTLQGTPINPPSGIINAPSRASLRDFLAAAGAPPDEMFGPVSARLFKLDESGPIPRPN